MRGRMCVIPSVKSSVTWWRKVVGTELLHAEHARISSASLEAAEPLTFRSAILGLLVKLVTYARGFTSIILARIRMIRGKKQE